MERRFLVLLIPTLVMVVLNCVAAAPSQDQVGVVLNPYQNELLRETMNKVAGRELIPKEAVFQLRSIVQTSTSSTIYFPDGSSAVLSSSSYAETSSADTFLKPTSATLILLSSALLFIWFNEVQGFY